MVCENFKNSWNCSKVNQVLYHFRDNEDVISGTAQAPLWPACIKVITSHVDPSSFGILVGLLGTAPYAGATFSSAFVSKMTDLYGWRHSIFPIFIPCVITSLLLLFGVSTGSKNDIATKKSTQGQKISYAKMTSIK